jgi:bifunctional UDP-N-acetylglucosamine pyrophosphorylase/glucosamine-1-phosphate N-acetyltransferase
LYQDQTAITEINSSVYAVNNEILFECLDKVKNKNVQKEYYLTDIVDIARKLNYKVNAYKTTDYRELSGINNKLQLMEMEMEYQKKILERHLLSGVSIHNPETVVIGKNVVLAPGVELFANTQIIGSTIVEKNTIIGPNSMVHDCKIGQGVKVICSNLDGVTVESNQIVGPFKYLHS